MKLNQSIKTSMSLAAAMGSFAFAGISNAAVMSTSGSVTADGDDIAQLSQTDADWGSSAIWGDRPARGQTFTSVGAGDLNSLTVRTNMGQGAGGTYVVRVSTVSGSDLTVIRTESATGVAVAADDYITFTFDSAVTLAASTDYAIDFARPSGGGFSSYRNTDDSSYTGGTAYSSGGSGAGNLTFSTHGHDRLFELDITAVPEPTTTALLGLGGLALILRRRK